MTKRNQKGFTLIELMIVVAIIGILAAIAIPAFMEYMNSGKGTEGEIQLNRLGKSAKAYYVKNSQFPQVDNAATPGGGPCALPNKTYTAANWPDLATTAPTSAFAVMGFAVEDNFRFDYDYTAAGADNFVANATADLDCNADGSTVVTATGTKSVSGAPSVVISTVGND